MSTVVLTTSQWQRIREELHTEYPKSVFMIKNKMKTILGFTVREHTEWIENHKAEAEGDYEWNQGYSKFSIRLDFYNKNKYTMFLLKFSEIINDKGLQL